jgi:hypothetical protein
MTMCDQSKSVKFLQWQATIEQWQHENSSVADFCRTRGIPQWKFHYWKRKIIIDSSDSTSTAPFVELKDSSNSSGIEINIHNQSFTLSIDNGFNEQTLSRVLKVIAQC